VTIEVRSTTDAAAALVEAGPYLRRDPVAHNVILSLLEARTRRSVAGQYWWAVVDGEVAGFVFQSPPTYSASLTPAPPAVIDALVDHVVVDRPDLPGAIGEVATAARFAGRWAERRRLPAAPDEGQRMYVLGSLSGRPDVAGRLERATAADVGLASTWIAGFASETGQPPDDTWAESRIADGRLWLWHGAGGPVSMAAATEPVAGVSRIGGVYTPPKHRAHGFAAACVWALSDWVIAEEAATCMLFTQLSNPTSNAIYQRLGYEAVAEVLAYHFG
jgi:GNAT superfamily N-acetyltransferase